MAAERLISGQNLIDHIYETNPPLNIMIYTPHVLFSKIIGLPLTIGAFYVTSFFVILSTLSVHLVLKSFTYLSKFEKATFILAHFVAITLATSLFFSDREHFIILGLIPFILCQHALTERIEIKSKILWPILIVGAICILIKPHYGLIPTIFLLNRAVNHRTLKIVFHPDFLALASATIGYILITIIFFNDFVTLILPDVLTLYAGASQNLSDIIKSSQIHLVLYLSVLFFELFREDLPENKKRFLIWFHLSCLICMVPYYVQMKGFYNHIVPAYAFFLIGTAMSFCFRIFNKSQKAPIFALIIPLCVMAGIIKTFSPLNTDFPKQSDVPNLPVAQYIEEYCQKPCTFFAFHSDIEIINPTAARMGYTHATRFPSFWFLPKIVKNPEKHNDLKEKYINYVAEDLTYYKPHIILIAKDLQVGSSIFDFVNFFGVHPDIKKLLQQKYTKTENFKFDKAAYFKGTTAQTSYIYEYDVYKLNP